jgi:D-glycero-alpha-D-manno-heptose-7-phosphate kinase
LQIHTSAPTRIDLAGGTIDIWPLYLYHEQAQTLNAAISLRAHAEITTRDDSRIAVSSVDIGRSLEVAESAELPEEGELALLGRLLRFFGAKGLALTTRAESPAGGGIAGSSALNIAVCAALNQWTGRGYDPETLLLVAMNVEAQAINVPTGVQDYRPALWRHRGEWVRGRHPARRVDRRPSSGTALSRTVASLAARYLPNNWEIISRHIDGDRQVFDRFERSSDTCRWPCAAPWTARIKDRPANRPRWENPSTWHRCHHAGHRELDRWAKAAGAQVPKVCGAGGGGCLFCWRPSGSHCRTCGSTRSRRAQLLDYHIERDGLRIL